MTLFWPRKLVDYFQQFPQMWKISASSALILARFLMSSSAQLVSLLSAYQSLYRTALVWETYFVFPREMKLRQCWIKTNNKTEENDKSTPPSLSNLKLKPQVLVQATGTDHCYYQLSVFLLSFTSFAFEPLRGYSKGWKFVFFLQNFGITRRYICKELFFGGIFFILYEKRLIF